MRYLCFILVALMPLMMFGSLPPQCSKDCKADERLFRLIRNMEGFSPVIYRDSVGIPTICFGHAIKKGETFKTPLTGKECQAILEKDIAETEAKVNSLVDASLYVNQHDALTDFAYNVGTGALKKSTLLKKVNSNQHNEVPAQIMRYVYAGDKKLTGLIIRRRLEASLYKAAP